MNNPTRTNTSPTVLLGNRLALRNWSLRTKLVSAFLLVALIPLGIVFYFNNQSTTQNLTDSANASLTGAAAETSAALDTFIADGLNNVRTAAQSHIWEEYLALLPAERAGSESEQVLYIDLRAQARRDQTYISSVGLLDTNGLDVADTVSTEVGDSKADHDYFKAVIQTGLPYVSPAEFSQATGELSIFFAAPVRDANGKIVGVLRICYNAAVLQQTIIQRATKLGVEGGEFILLDENHIRLAVSGHPDMILKSVTPLRADKLAQLQAERRLPADQPVEDLSTNLPEFEEGLTNAASQPIFAAETLPRGEESGDETGEQIAVAGMDTQPWLVAAAQQQAIYLAPVAAQTRTAVIATLIIAALVAAAAVLVAQTISRPVVNLTNVAQQIAAGDRVVQAKVEAGDEIGQLAGTFNQMTGQLRKSFEDLDRRAAQLATVAEVGISTSTILESDRLLQEVVDLTKERFNLYHSHIYLLDEAGKTLVLVAGAGEPGRQMKAKGFSIPLNREQSLVARAAREQKGVTVNDVTQAPDFLPNPLLPDTRSELAVPMIVGNRLVGVFDVQSEVVGRFTDADINIQITLAAQVATSIQNVRQYEQAQKRAAELASVAEVSTVASRELNVEKMLSAVVHLTQRRFGLYHAHVFIFNENTAELKIAACGWKEGDEHEGTHGTAVIPLTQEQSLVARAGRTRQAVIVNDVHNEPGWLPNPLLPDTASELAVPLVIGDRLLGVLDVQSDRPDAFTQEDASIQIALASQVATALQNARSYAEARRQAEVETMLNVIGQKIQSTTKVEAALQIAARELGHALGMRQTLVTLDPASLAPERKSNQGA